MISELHLCQVDTLREQCPQSHSSGLIPKQQKSLRLTRWSNDILQEMHLIINAPPTDEGMEPRRYT
jgi:hypothetical protein